MRLLLALLLAAATDPDGRIVVSAEELARAYYENVVAADARFKGKALTVTGRVDRIQRHIENPDPELPVVLLNTGDETGIGYIVCLWKKGEPESPLASVKKGARITLHCVGAGGPVNVELRDCRLARG